MEDNTNENIEATQGAREIPSAKSELWREAFSWFKTIAFALIFAWVFTNFVIVNATVPTGSMEGTIRVGDRIVAFRLSYLFSSPQRYDIIVFRGPEADSDLYVKRVIGLPGETIEIREGRVYINGYEEPLRDDFVSRHNIENWPLPVGGEIPEIVIPEDSFFVLGDNRGNSLDSRNHPRWETPFVSRGQIRGRVIFRYLPNFQNLTR